MTNSHTVGEIPREQASLHHHSPAVKKHSSAGDKGVIVAEDATLQDDPVRVAGRDRATALGEVSLEDTVSNHRRGVVDEYTGAVAQRKLDIIFPAVDDRYSLENSGVGLSIDEEKAAVGIG